MIKLKLNEEENPTKISEIDDAAKADLNPGTWTVAGDTLTIDPSGPITASGTITVASDTKTVINSVDRYPLGFIFKATNNEDPNNILPGTWVKRAESGTSNSSGTTIEAYWERVA